MNRLASRDQIYTRKFLYVPKSAETPPTSPRFESHENNNTSDTTTTTTSGDEPTNTTTTTSSSSTATSPPSSLQNSPLLSTWTHLSSNPSANTTSSDNNNSTNNNNNNTTESSPALAQPQQQQYRPFKLTHKQEKHALMMLQIVPELASLRFKLVPKYLNDDKFWYRIYMHAYLLSLSLSIISSYVISFQLY